MDLPKPTVEGPISVERAIKHRRSVREFKPSGLTAEQLAQLLWAAQGITEDRGYKRAVASAGALYPMDVYVALGDNAVPGIRAGVYHYTPSGHGLALVIDGDRRADLARASLGQSWMAQAPLNVVICAEYARVTVKYGQRGVRYAMIEAGHVGQNLFLQAQALGLEAGIVGAFHDERVARVLQIPASHEPLLIMPVGFGLRA